MNKVFRKWYPFILKFSLLLLICLFFGQTVVAVDGSDLWLSKHSTTRVTVLGSLKTPMLQLACKELQEGWQGSDGATFRLTLKKDKSLKVDGFRLDSFTIQSNSEKGILYGVFDLLRRQQTGQPISNIVSNPSYEFRLLNHWDNPDGSVERGYAGRSIFWRGDGSQLAVTEADRALWQKYARANASIGINGSVLNNVNADPQALSADFLLRTSAIAKELRLR